MRILQRFADMERDSEIIFKEKKRENGESVSQFLIRRIMAFDSTLKLFLPFLHLTFVD